MDIAFLLHLYQPITQEESVFRQVFTASYLPLIKFIRNTKRFRLSLSMPLSLLEQMDKYGYGFWLEDMKDLINSERVELVGGAAYHPLLTRLPLDLAEKQIILNEFGLGYYFGRHTGFEGEHAVLVKDLLGFFPPELAVDKNLVLLLSNLGYDWVVVDEGALPEGISQPKYGVYTLEDCSTKIICRNKGFSNWLSFKRDLGTGDMHSSLEFYKRANRSFVAVLDGEFFGHHFKEGIHLLDILVGVCGDMGVGFTTVGDLSSSSTPQSLDTLRLSTWGMSEQDITNGDIYPFWDIASSDVHKLQWEVLNRVVSDIKLPEGDRGLEGSETLPIWKFDSLDALEDENARNAMKLGILLHQSLHSDQFWWASKKELSSGEFLYNPEMIKAGLDRFCEVAKLSGDEKLFQFVQAKREEALGLL